MKGQRAELLGQAPMPLRFAGQEEILGLLWLPTAAGGEAMERMKWGSRKTGVPDTPKLPECTWWNYLPVFPTGFYPTASVCFYSKIDPQEFWGPEAPAEAGGRKAEGVHLLLEEERMWLPAEGLPSSWTQPFSERTGDHQRQSQHSSEPRPWEGPRGRLGVQV